MNRTWTPLRIAVTIAGLLGTLFWLGSIVQWAMIATEKRDGFELMGIAVSSLFFLVLVLPTLLMGLLGRWLIFGALLGAAAVALASDTLWPWLPW